MSDTNWPSPVLGHVFSRSELLRQALTHRSHGAHNNERLEFLGDGVLDCVIAAALFARYPQLAEGDLTRLRAHLVREETLASIARQLGLDRHLMLGEGEIRSGGQHRPSILADAFEALVGAVFLDGGYDAAAGMVLQCYQGKLDRLDPVTAGKDAKTRLQELLQAEKEALPVYRVMSIDGEAHQQTFQVICEVPSRSLTGTGSGNSRRAAEQQAASVVLQQVLEA